MVGNTVMTPVDAAFIRRCIKRYYFERFDAVELPSNMIKREFGYMAGAGMTRHIQLHEPADLRVLLLQEAPLDMFVSNARYMFPDLAMKDKVMEYAHLIFDIDAKDIGLDCRPSHTATVCGRCGNADAGPHSTCKRCGNADVRPVSIACLKCMRAAGDHAARLLKILADDFGVDDVGVYFSGNEGYHVHVRDGGLAGLSRAARAEIADYMSLHKVAPERLAHMDKKPVLPARSDVGWRGRFSRALSKADRATMSKEMVAGVHTTRARVLSDMERELGIRVDAGVTMDVHRIFRMPGTINSKSCMAKVACEDPKSFDPYRSAVVLPDEPVCVRASCPVRFRLMGRRFGPYSGEYVEAPMYAAAYMVCKGLAHVVG